MQDLLQSGIPRLADLLDAPLMAQILAAGRDVHYADGQLIYRRGDLSPGISILKSGRVVARIIGTDGSVLTNSTLSPGQCFGEFTLFAGLPRTHDISAVGDTVLTQISGRRFLALFDREPRIARALLTISLHRSFSLVEFMDDLRRLPLIVRIAKILMSRIPQQDVRTETITFRQDELAFTLGVSRVSVGKALKRLERDGYVRLGYGRIELPDVPRFRVWVEEQSLVTPLVPVAT